MNYFTDYWATLLEVTLGSANGSLKSVKLVMNKVTATWLSWYL